MEFVLGRARKREDQKLFYNMEALFDQVTFLPGFHFQTQTLHVTLQEQGEAAAACFSV